MENKIPSELQALLDATPEVTEQDLKELATANRALKNDPEFQADLLKAQFLEQAHEAMEERNENFNTLAKAWGKSRQYVSKIFNEEKPANFTINSMSQIAGLLGKKLHVSMNNTEHHIAAFNAQTWPVSFKQSLPNEILQWNKEPQNRPQPPPLVCLSGRVAKQDSENAA